MSKQVSNKTQLAKLVELMEKQKHLAKGVCSKQYAKQAWEQIAIALNNYGPPFKTAEKWSRVWIDMKAKVKKKLSENRSELRATGGGPNLLHSFNPLESAVEQLLELNRTVNPPGQEFGLSDGPSSSAALRIEKTAQIQNISTLNASLDVEIPVSLQETFSATLTDAESLVICDDEDYDKDASVLVENVSTSRSTRPKAKKSETLDLLKDQTNHQKIFYEDTSKKMNSLVNTLTEIKVQQDSFFKKFLKLKEEELQIAKLNKK